MDHDKEDLQRYLQQLREAVIWKMEGLTQRQLRWPQTPSGTNLLGMVKHLSALEFGYLGMVFDRPGEPTPWLGPDSEPEEDMWATPDESSAWLLGLYGRACAHANETIASLSLDSTGYVPWWSEEKRHPTLHTIIVHVTIETARHLGHIDIVRELTDGGIGLYAHNANTPGWDPEKLRRHKARLEEVALGFD
ncbi:MAG TPA: DinB family protein [Candidatus Stackebrandtia faecavium]|nr:DinB family protein [Candidatus Stackebrandtia faecavium]